MTPASPSPESSSTASAARAIARLATEAIEALGIPVVGALPRSDDIALPERHLGLVQAAETNDLHRRLERDGGFRVPARPHRRHPRRLRAAPAAAVVTGTRTAVAPPGQRIAVARDEAFSFVYPHLLQGWRSAGAEISFFSPLADEGPGSDCDAAGCRAAIRNCMPARLAASQHFFDQLRDFAATRPFTASAADTWYWGQQ